MKERPILFSAPMVRALLAGTKTQTRRAVNPQPYTHLARFSDVEKWHWRPQRGGPLLHPGTPEMLARCPYGVPGDRLWVREAWRTTGDGGRCNGMPPRDMQPHDVWCEADGLPPADECAGKLRPSMFMPRWASRILMEVTEVRAERLQDISEADARAEGIVDGGCTSCGEPEPCGCAAPAPSARDAYCYLWGEINGPDSWAANPWVWVVGFKVIAPKDAISQAARGR